MAHQILHLIFYTITKFGEGLFLVPAAVGLALWMAPQANGVRLAGWWLAAVGMAATITAASKIAFMGWGIGSATWDFTGVSGHTMFATAIYPLLFRTAASHSPPNWKRWSVVAGYALAVLIGVSRVKVHAHSWSEVVVGFIVGGAASGLVLAWVHMPRFEPPRWLIAAIALWLVALPYGVPKPPTHSWVTRIALHLSGRTAPFTREDLLRESSARAAASAAPSVAPVAVPAADPAPAAMEPADPGRSGADQLGSMKAGSRFSRLARTDST